MKTTHKKINYPVSSPDKTAQTTFSLLLPTEDN